MADVILTVGDPGKEVSAHIDVLDTGDYVDVGSMIEEELAELNPTQIGYRKDMVKYKKQIERYKDEKFNK